MSNEKDTSRSVLNKIIYVMYVTTLAEDNIQRSASDN